MADLHLSEHISKQFNTELEDVRNRVLAMGGLVEQQVLNAVKAIMTIDAELAESVVAKDRKVNGMEVQVDEECNRILARRHPTASDLRLIVAIIKTITDLERIGDEAKKVAKMTIHLADQDHPSDGYAIVKNISRDVSSMLNGALDAFARLDVQAAMDIVKADQAVDQEYEAVMRQCMTYMMEDPRKIQRVMNLIWAVRALERIGDHAANMAEYVIYLVKGKDVRHISVEDLEQELSDL